MKTRNLLFITLLLTLLSACTPTTHTNPAFTPTQTFALLPPPPTKINTPIPSPTLTLTPTPAPISLDNLPSGLYIVISNYDLDQQLILDLEGNVIGVFLDFYAFGAIINPQNSVLAYITDSGAISRKRPELFDYPIGLYDLDADEVIPIEFDEGYRAENGTWTWSPDGTKLIFIDWCPGCRGWGSDHRLGVIDLNKNTYARINLGEGYVSAYAADWSPDGKWIAFSTTYFSGDGSRLGGYFEIFLMDASCLDDVDTCKSHLKMVFGEEGMDYTKPFWFPDNRHLFFKCRDYETGNLDWCIGDVTTGEITIILNKPEDGNYPNLSPDGEWIAYLNDDYSIYIMSLDGAEERMIVEHNHDIRLYNFYWLTIP